MQHGACSSPYSVPAQWVLASIRDGVLVAGWPCGGPLRSRKSRGCGFGALIRPADYSAAPGEAVERAQRWCGTGSSQDPAACGRGELHRRCRGVACRRQKSPISDACAVLEQGIHKESQPVFRPDPLRRSVIQRRQRKQPFFSQWPPRATHHAGGIRGRGGTSLAASVGAPVSGEQALNRDHHTGVMRHEKRPAPNKARIAWILCL